MALTNFGKFPRIVLTGVVGAVAYDLGKRAARSIPVRDVAVTSVAWGLRRVRRVERTAEAARLVTADVVAEARSRIGEQAPAPGTAAPDHQH